MNRDEMRYSNIRRLDRTFINNLSAAICPPAIITLSKDQINYIIIGPHGDMVSLDIIACLRRSYNDHKDMIRFVRWKVLNERIY